MRRGSAPAARLRRGQQRLGSKQRAKRRAPPELGRCPRRSQVSTFVRLHVYARLLTMPPTILPHHLRRDIARVAHRRVTARPAVRATPAARVPAAIDVVRTWTV